MKIWVTDTSARGGPSIFGRRLAEELSIQGHKIGRLFPNLQISIGRLSFEPAGMKLLRLDGLYLDEPWNPDSRRLNRRLRSGYKNAGRVVFQSRYSQAQYFAWFGERSGCEVIPNGIAFSTIPRGVPRFDDLVCASAEWRPNKRIGDLVKVFRHPKLTRSVRLRIIGHVPESERSQIGHLPNNVQIIGRQSEYDVLLECSKASAFAHFAWLDWCPNSVVEALACGTPVICTSSGGTKELVQNNGIIVNTGDDVPVGTPVRHRDPPSLPIGDMVEATLRIMQHQEPIIRPDLDLNRVAAKYAKQDSL